MSLFGKKQSQGPRTAQEREAARREREAARARELGKPVDSFNIEPLAPSADPQINDPSIVLPDESHEDEIQPEPTFATETVSQPEHVPQEPVTAPQDITVPDSSDLHQPEPESVAPAEPVPQEAEVDNVSAQDQHVLEPEMQSGDPLAAAASTNHQDMDEPSQQSSDFFVQDADSSSVEPAVKVTSQRRHVGSFPSKKARYDAPQQRLANGRRVPRRPRWITRGRAYAFVIFAVFCAFLWLFSMVFQPFTGKGNGTVIVKVPVGMNAGSIGKLLAKRDVVDSGFLFSVRVTLAGKRDNLSAGTFTLKHDMSYIAAIDTLTKAPLARTVQKPVTVTVAEGQTRRQFASASRKAGLRGSYRKASARSSVLSPQRYGAPKRTRTLEGFLFPDTYELKGGSTAKQFVEYQLRTFQQKTGGIGLKPSTRKRGLTAYELLIVASMVERETSVAKERPIVASVIYNRLQQKMVLGIDATIRYQLNNWSRPLRVSELQRDTAYNTRKRQGLPPTPIGNPGIAAIRAALRPAKTSYLYYVAKPGSCGHAFSSTDAEFQQDVARYNTERAKRGGQSPTARGC